MSVLRQSFRCGDVTRWSVKQRACFACRVVTRAKRNPIYTSLKLSAGLAAGAGIYLGFLRAPV
jgi:hypothetical protein